MAVETKHNSYSVYISFSRWRHVIECYNHSACYLSASFCAANVEQSELSIFPQFGFGIGLCSLIALVFFLFYIIIVILFKCSCCGNRYISASGNFFWLHHQSCSVVVCARG